MGELVVIQVAESLFYVGTCRDTGSKISNIMLLLVVIQVALAIICGYLS